jgi:hypothetical protein
VRIANTIEARNAIKRSSVAKDRRLSSTVPIILSLIVRASFANTTSTVYKMNNISSVYDSILKNSTFLQLIPRKNFHHPIDRVPLIKTKNKLFSRCSDGFLRIYLKGQDISVTYLYEKHDHELCSNNVSSPYWSEGQRLSMIFSSGQSQGSGFKARFLFATGAD